jgi:GntR family transcriptional regulator
MQGQGTFVSIPKVEMVQGELISITTLMQRQGHIPETLVIALRREPLNAIEAAKLGEPIGEDVYFFQRVRKANGVMVVLENTRMPSRKVPNIDQYDLVKSSVFSLMADVYHYTDLTVHQTIEADIASEEIAKILEIEQNSPVLCVNRMVHDHNGELVEAAQDIYPASRIRFVYEGKINLQESQQKFKNPSASVIEMQ